jgi:hypothetical protein
MTDTTGEYLAVYAQPQGGTKVICPVKIADEADARLIAAAPELLNAAQAAYHALESYAHGNAAPELARNVARLLDLVIAKAEGR